MDALGKCIVLTDFGLSCATVLASCIRKKCVVQIYAERFCLYIRMTHV